MGESGVMKLLNGAIFSLTIGSNDFFDYLEPSIPLIGQSKLSHTMLQDAMVSNLTLQLKVRNPYWLNLKLQSHVSLTRILESLSKMSTWSLWTHGCSCFKRLHNLGARKFVVVGVGPLGCIPFVRALNLLPSGRCSSDVNNLVQGYNKKLRKMLYQLNEELGPSVVFVYANSFDIVTGIITHYQEYGEIFLFKTYWESRIPYARVWMC